MKAVCVILMLRFVEEDFLQNHCPYASFVKPVTVLKLSVFFVGKLNFFVLEFSPLYKNKFFVLADQYAVYHECMRNYSN